MFLVVASFLVILSGCGTSAPLGEIVYISYEDYKNMKNEDGAYMVLISQTDCSHCIAYKENVLDDYLHNHEITVYELNVTNEENPRAVFTSLSEELGMGFQGTPATIIIENKEIKELISGEISTTELDEIVTDYQLDNK